VWPILQLEFPRCWLPFANAARRPPRNAYQSGNRRPVWFDILTPLAPSMILKAPPDGWKCCTIRPDKRPWDVL
jgi:hypothetical protein